MADWKDSLATIPIFSFLTKEKLKEQLTSGDPAHPTFLSIGARPDRPAQFYAEGASNLIGKLDGKVTGKVTVEERAMPAIERVLQDKLAPYLQ